MRPQVPIVFDSTDIIKDEPAITTVVVAHDTREDHHGPQSVLQSHLVALTRRHSHSRKNKQIHVSIESGPDPRAISLFAQTVPQHDCTLSAVGREGRSGIITIDIRLGYIRTLFYLG